MKKLTLATAALSLVNVILLVGILYGFTSGRLVWNNGEVSIADLTSETVRLSDYRFDAVAGRRRGQGALTLFDRVTDKKFVELGFYKFGAGIFTPHRFEFWTGKEVSIAARGHLPALQIRNQRDTEAGVWLNGAGFVGTTLESLGFAFGSFKAGWKEVGRFEDSGDFIVHKDIWIGGQSVSERLDRLEKAMR